MKRSILLLGVISCIIISPASAFQSLVSEDSASTIILVRHAEKEGAGRDPDLSEEGRSRAESLKEKMSAYPLTEIFSTPFKRTMNTAKPAAEAFGIEIQEYMPQKDMKPFLTQIIQRNKGTAVLIVGHSNTTPGLVNQLLGEERLNDLNESQYGDLFIVRVIELGDGKLTTERF